LAMVSVSARKKFCFTQLSRERRSAGASRRTTPLATIAAVAQSARQKAPASQTAALGKIEEVALDASGLAGRSAGAHARGTRRYAITRAG
jgi:hypothetical protein